MRPLLVDVPALWVGLISAPLVAYLIVQSELPKAWRKPGAVAGVVAVAGLTAYYWHESMPVHAYGVMLAVAALVAITIGVARAPIVGFSKVETVDLGLFGVLWGVIGARMFHVFENAGTYFTSDDGILSALAIWNGGLVFYGGLLGGMAYVVYFAFRHSNGTHAILRIFDLGAPCVMFGLAFGRVGCFLNGCCYGNPSDLPWAVAYRTGVWNARLGGFGGGSHISSSIYTAGTRASQWRDLMGQLDVPETLTPVTFHVHPAQVYASVMAVLIGIGLSLFFYRRPRPGAVTCALLLVYSVDRFILEGWFRGDTPQDILPLSGSLTISQYVSIVGFAAGLIWLGVILRQRYLEKKARAAGA